MSLSLAGSGQISGFDAGLSGFGGLVAVKHALKTDTQASSSIAGGGSVAVSGLSVTHSLADAANKLIITAYLGQAASSNNFAAVAMSVADDGTFIGIGDAAGSRVRVGAGGVYSPSSGTFVVDSPSVTFVYAPGDTASHTYAVYIQNITTGSVTLYVNRSADDTDSAGRSRAASALIVQEVKV